MHTHFGAALRGRAWLLGSWRNIGTAPEVMLELDLERWIEIGRCSRRGQGEERWVLLAEVKADVRVQVHLRLSGSIVGDLQSSPVWLEHGVV